MASLTRSILSSGSNPHTRRPLESVPINFSVFWTQLDPNIFADGYGSRTQTNSWHGENEAFLLLWPCELTAQAMMCLRWKKKSRRNYYPEFSRKHQNTHDTIVQSWRNSNLSSRPFLTRMKLTFTLHMNPETTDHHWELHVANSVLCRPAPSNLTFPLGDLEPASPETWALLHTKRFSGALS